jgi:hypothetical protein
LVLALEAMLTEHATPPGNWWSVAREALAMLGELSLPKLVTGIGSSTNSSG